MPPHELSDFNFWYQKEPESIIPIDFLLPNGLCINLQVPATTTLADLKAALWNEAEKYPLFDKLKSYRNYIFACVGRRGGVEELVDEESSLFFIQPFKPYLKVVEKQGDETEKLFNARISMLIGKSLTEFENLKNEEVEDFRRKYRKFCESVAVQRGRASWEIRAMYTFPPELAETYEIPAYMADKLKSDVININVAVAKNITNTLGVPYDCKPSDLLTVALKKKAFTLKKPPENAQDYVLKVVGRESYLLGFLLEGEEYPLIQYKYIRDCIIREKKPQLSLVAKCDLKVEERPRAGTLADSAPPVPPKQEKKGISLWHIGPSSMFKIKIVCATNINAGNMKKAITCGIYHGGESLCDIISTKKAGTNSPNWNEYIEFSLAVCDIPRMARLCLCIYGYAEQKKKKDRETRGVPLAWVNTTIFDYKGFLRTGPCRLYCWNFSGQSANTSMTLNPLGTVVSNSSFENAPCVLLEFPKFAEPVVYPPDDKILELAAAVTGQHDGQHPFLTKGSKQHREQIEQILAKDPLAPMFEQDKELLWFLRAECCDDYPESLPKLIQSIKWNSRHDVAQMYFLLQIWRMDKLSPDISLELLDYTYADTKVRKFAVDLLDKMRDSDLEHYLLQLVQALKYESYLDCSLTRFLLKRALNNRRIGHFLFWHLRSEMYNPEVAIRYGLMLEAYCRGSVEHVESLKKQYEAINKMKTVTELLQNSTKRDQDKLKLMRECFAQPTYKEAFSSLQCPLDPSIKLKLLKVEQCKYMNSKKKPLWLVFENEDELGEDVHVMFKNGDDLRQDMLTLQTLKVMDLSWKSEGLDMHLIPYGCLSTGQNMGMIEVVRESETVARIQAKLGSIKGVIRDDSLYHWMQTTEKDPENLKKMVEDFTLSCAGYCVATYVLGIGDRHNDNIMVKASGELFHIDFGHFLGNFKSKFGIRRERVPFVFTDDFIYVITHGLKDRNSPEFKRFQELCIEAFRVLRRKGNLLMTLFAMMLSTGIPELQDPSDLDHIRKSLCLTQPEPEALNHFLETFKLACDGSRTTSMNWIVHNFKHYWNE